MKNHLCKLLLVIYLFPTVSLGQAQSNLESQIKSVEQGLLPAVLIKGEPGWSIPARMKYYRAPWKDLDSQNLGAGVYSQ